MKTILALGTRADCHRHRRPRLRPLQLYDEGERASNRTDHGDRRTHAYGIVAADPRLAAGRRRRMRDHSRRMVEDELNSALSPDTITDERTDS